MSLLELNDGEWHKTAEIAGNLGLKDTRTKEFLKELIALDIKSVVELVDFIGEQEEKIQQIEDRQHEIYRESSSRKRKISTEAQYREYQIWHVEVQEERDELKQEKREIKRQLQLTDGIIKEDLYTAYYAVSEKEELVADREIEIPGMEEEAVFGKMWLFSRRRMLW